MRKLLVAVMLTGLSTACGHGSPTLPKGFTVSKSDGTIIVTYAEGGSHSVAGIDRQHKLSCHGKVLTVTQARTNQNGPVVFRLSNASSCEGLLAGIEAK